ncbi:MAG TPA: protein kinase, partial [Planctomycetaceae bacterium]|nr:protein kinase [Planctomycetaceae bacterium]
ANYMAPELIKRQRTDQRIDVFSFAVTCYEMYTRRYPWAAAETLEMVLQHINSPPHDIREFVPAIDDQIADAIMKGLATDPAKRWNHVLPMIQQFREVNTRLKQARAGKPGLSQSTSEISAYQPTTDESPAAAAAQGNGSPDESAASNSTPPAEPSEA